MQLGTFALLLLATLGQTVPDFAKNKKDLFRYFDTELKRIEQSCLSHLSTKEAWEKERPVMRQQFMEMMGLWPLPAKTELKAEKIKFDPATPIGGMIEIPSAALAAEWFARRLDFLSIGTNDLIQYTLAIDRTDDAVAHLYDPLNPGVIQLIAHTLKVGRRLRKPVSVCGEMAGDPTLTRLLLGLGLRGFSMHPAHILAVKQQVLRSQTDSLEPLAVKLTRQGSPDKIQALLNRINA